MWHWRCSDGRGTAIEWTMVVVYNCGQPLHHQLYRVTVHHRAHCYQPLRLRLLARHLRCSVHSLPNRRCRGVDVADRPRPRLAQPPWLVVARVWREDSEVSVGPHYRLPLHHPLRRRRHAATVRRRRCLLLAHLRLYSTCEAAHSQNALPGKIRRFTDTSVPGHFGTKALQDWYRTVFRHFGISAEVSEHFLVSIRQCHTVSIVWLLSAKTNKKFTSRWDTRTLRWNSNYRQNHAIVVKLYYPYIQFPVTFAYLISESQLFSVHRDFFDYCAL